MACLDCPPPNPAPQGNCPDCEKKKRTRKKKLPTPPPPTDCEAPCVSAAPQAAVDNAACDDQWDSPVRPVNPPMGKPTPTATHIATATATYGTGTRTGTQTITRTITSTATSTRPPTGSQNYLSSAITKTFYKANCPTGYVATPYNFILPSGAFRSAISQEDADLRAKTYMDKVGQIEANLNGVCEYAPLGVTAFTGGILGQPLNCPDPEELIYGVIFGQPICD